MFQMGCLFFAFTSLVFADWVFEENKALTLSSERNLPILAVFLVEEGCCWSDQLKTELFQKPEFIKEISQEMVLWQVFLKQKKEIRDKYQVQECPLILLLDPKGREFARLNFIPLDHKLLKELVISLINDFSTICSFIDTDFDEEKWQIIYQKASRLSASCFKEKILEQGVKKEKGCFFHLEKYAQLLQEKGSRHPYVLKFKKKTLRKDKMHQLGARACLASIEFHDRNRKGKSVDKTIEPLLEYLHTSALIEAQYRWEIELLLGQFLWKKNRLEKAREYLLLAYKHAPNAFKLQLQEIYQLEEFDNQ
ncbi:hypothetical protein RHABOEDO_000592 [Candidatus Rhabdochlamydia oedothoracis]|uniref:Thioredoxin-like fold domain-containing protein n=1 Tax=Candidatus Rhabdochlamydia oedothoracis TaxID=2720720 RepID=A0ABX8UZX4_9BACT|nr:MULTISPECIES: hypothetical protein [Rhabdochlamydia]KAG6559222.1 hypothetical protein RHOW815_000787 [Candidatus Rhabdochlamydia sp. W815]QYF48431.1 hypothetical protein RHABOEDO_000592 [Candidatus Rhabdochlamydia oedothoracis]